MTHELLKARQALDLEAKELLSEIKIKEFYHRLGGRVYVSFSGGKDSTVLLHLVRRFFPDVVGVFCDTGLEYPEIRKFVKTIDNVTWVKPKITFKQVLEKYGYPVVSKDQACAISRYRTTKSQEQKYYRLNGFPNGKKGMIAKKWQYLLNAPFKISEKCCDIMKKAPLKKYAKITNRNPFIGTMTRESNVRAYLYLRTGCNSFEGSNVQSIPLAFWTERDIWEYIKKYNLTYSSIYDMGYNRTGCVFCMFGAHLGTGENRFQKLEKTHPQLYKYCIYNLGLNKILDYMNIPYTTKWNILEEINGRKKEEI